MIDLTTPVIAIIIPCYNEDLVLRKVVTALTEEKKYTIIIIDDGSATPAKKLVGDLPVTIIRHKVNLGQGAALQTGFEYAKRINADYAITFDADGQHQPEDIANLLEPLLNDTCDVALGSRFLKGSQSNISKGRKSVLKTARYVNFFLANIWLSDAHNGIRALNKTALQKIELKENNMAHPTEFLLKMKKMKLRYQEVPVHILYTEYSKTKGQSSFNSIRIFFDLVLHKLFE
jgi:polyprenyl-phospho-N-acetylgalactosaminyl synthase